LSPRALLALLLTAATAMPLPLHAQRSTEIKPMSDQASPAALEHDVNAALAEYDRTRTAEALRDAVDILVRDDGTVPNDPASAATQAQAELRLWIALLSRFHRDLDPKFDPAQPPPTSVAPPEINGEQMLPGTKPDDIADPNIRKQYEAAIAANAARVKNFTAMFKLSAIHPTTIERAIASLRNARDTLGLPAAEIAAAVQKADIAVADKTALLAGVR
jgi:hypothetical protein